MAVTYRITDVTSLRGMLLAPRNAKIIVSLPDFAGSQAADLERQFNRLSSACGCNTSAASFVIVVAACVVIDGIFWPNFTRDILLWLGVNLLACILAIGIGKQLGIFYARLKLGRLVGRIEAQITKGEGRQSICIS